MGNFGFANIASEKLIPKRFLVTNCRLFAFVILNMSSFNMPVLFLLFAIFGGVAYAFGYLFFYKGFEIGNVSVVSAVINLQIIFVMAISFFIRGQKLSIIQIPAIVLLILGVSLVSVNFEDLKKGTVNLLKGVKESFIAAVILGFLLAVK
jgi:drug/metabolite transporter (DMT)-like permease